MKSGIQNSGRWLSSAAILLLLAMNCFVSNPVPEVRETRICYVRELIRMTADYGISHLIPKYD